MNRTLLITAFMIPASLAAAITVDVTPGTLYTRFNELGESADTELTLTGRADVRDLALLQNLPDHIVTLDMSALTITPYTYETGSHLGQIHFEGGEIPLHLLAGTKISSCILPGNAVKVGDGAFAATSIREISIPAGVSEIGANAFANCKELTKASLPGVKNLGTGTFLGCSSLAEVRLSDSVDEIPASMFDGCHNLVMQLPFGVKRIGDRAFYGTALRSVDLSEVNEIGRFAFAEMPELAELTVNTTTSYRLGTGAFFNDPQLSVLPDFKGDIPAIFAVNHHGPITKIDSETVSEGAFANNTETDKIQLGPKVRKIERHAFRNLKSLTEIDALSLVGNVPELDPEAFSGLEGEDGNYNIRLTVESGTEHEWKGTEWKRFNINPGSATDISYLKNVNISAERLGESIIVTSSELLKRVEIYDTDGVKLFETNASVEKVKAEGIPSGRPVIIRAETEGTLKVFKLM